MSGWFKPTPGTRRAILGEYAEPVMERMMPPAVIETEYPDFPAVYPVTFSGPRTRPEYQREIINEDGEPEMYNFGLVLEERATVLNAVLRQCNSHLSAMLEAYKSKQEFTIDAKLLAKIVEVIKAFSGAAAGGGYKIYDDKTGRTITIRTGRIEKMMVYDNFFKFVHLLSQLQDNMKEQVNVTKDSIKRMLTEIMNRYPVLLMQLRVTPMGPEPNQVTNMCKTQAIYGKNRDGVLTRTSQSDQCNTVYDMCRGKQDKYGVIDHKRDLTCARYIKSLVFPRESAVDKDVRAVFQSYDYARDGPDYLKPLVTQHNWQVEYDLDKKLKQWDTTYTNDQAVLTYSDGSKVRVDDLNYADRGVRNLGNRQERDAAVGKLVSTREADAAGRQRYAAAYDQAELEYQQRQAEAEGERTARLVRTLNFMPSDDVYQPVPRNPAAIEAALRRGPTRGTPRRR